MGEQTQLQANQEEGAQQGAGAAAGETPAQQGEAETQTFEGWYKALPSEVQGLVDDHVDGLKSALTTERGERKALEKRLKEIQKQADAGGDVKGQLQQLSDEMAAATARATFFEAAHAADVKNLRLAWLAANDAGLVDKKTGAVDFAELRKVAPELFVSKAAVPPAHAGAGAKQSGVAKAGMNDFLRAATGRGG
jgi:hypothetical protein